MTTDWVHLTRLAREALHDSAPWPWGPDCPNRDEVEISAAHEALIGALTPDVVLELLDLAHSMHVLPRGDLFDHTERPDCTCGPDPVEAAVGHRFYVHHSLDGRERHEGENR